jgi:transcriptional regulator with XRE-family HTH domain
MPQDDPIKLEAGERLRRRRERLRLTLRDVERFSHSIAERHRSTEFLLTRAWISKVEGGSLPSIYSLYSFSIIYLTDLAEILEWYGIRLNDAGHDLSSALLPLTQQLPDFASLRKVEGPLRLDPSFNPKRTTSFTRMIEKWGAVPLVYANAFLKKEFSYGYIGTDDFTMFPLIRPGSFVQIDQSKTEVREDVGASSELERPIYWIETRDGYICSWCSIKGSVLTVQPHPLSGQDVRMLRHPQDAEVVGRVVGIAMSLHSPPRTADERSQSK